MTTKISTLLVRAIVFFAVLGIIFLLTMYNVKLLYTLNWFKTTNKMLDLIVIIIASVSYSLGSISVVVWYNPIKQKTEKELVFGIRYFLSVILKLLFVLIDGIHVYVYNNTHINDLAKWLSPVYAIQTALILFFVGSIVNDIIKNGKQKENKDKTKFKELENRLKTKEIYIKEFEDLIQGLKADNKHKGQKIEKMVINLEKYQQDVEELKNAESDFVRILKEKEKEIEKYYPYYLKLRVSSIRKKAEKNRTEEEWAILQEYEQIKEHKK